MGLFLSVLKHSSPLQIEVRVMIIKCKLNYTILPLKLLPISHFAVGHDWNPMNSVKICPLPIHLASALTSHHPDIDSHTIYSLQPWQMELCQPAPQAPPLSPTSHFKLSHVSFLCYETPLKAAVKFLYLLWSLKFTDWLWPPTVQLWKESPLRVGQLLYF